MRSKTPQTLKSMASGAKRPRLSGQARLRPNSTIRTIAPTRIGSSALGVLVRSGSCSSSFVKDVGAKWSESFLLGRRHPRRRKLMKKEYDLKKLRKRAGRAKTHPGAPKVPVSMLLDGAVLAHLRTESRRAGIPYQTFGGSIIHP